MGGGGATWAWQWSKTCEAHVQPNGVQVQSMPWYTGVQSPRDPHAASEVSTSQAATGHDALGMQYPVQHPFATPATLPTGQAGGGVAHATAPPHAPGSVGPQAAVGMQ